MAHLYNELFPDGNSVNFSENMFRVFDTDNTGVINFREFLVAMNITSNGTPEEKLSFAFNLYDVNGDGNIEYLEMLKLVNALFDLRGVQRTVGVSGSVFEKLAKNEDGMVSQKEFITACQEDDKLRTMLNPV